MLGAVNGSRALSYAAPDGIAGSVAAALVCCLVSTPCSTNVTCRTVTDPADCRGLAEAQLPAADDDAAWTCRFQNLHALQNLPSWGVVAYPFIYTPLAVMFCTNLLWKVLRRIYRIVSTGERTHKFIMNYIGCRDHPYPRSIELTVFMHYLQILLSVMTMGAFVLRTYSLAISDNVRQFEQVSCVVLLFHYSLNCVKNEFHQDFLWDRLHVVDVFTLSGIIYSRYFPDPDGKDWLSLGFLRLVSALASFEKLGELGALNTGGNEIVQHITRMIFRFVAFVACFGSFVMIFEVLGDPVRLRGVHVRTAMGDIDYFTVVYWMIETISLVGYGDFTPKTNLARLVTILTMVSGFAVFTFEVGKIVSMIDKGKRGAGSYVLKARDHVVLVGGGVQNLDETFMTAFLDELYHSSYRTSWPDLVLMTCGSDSLNKARDLFNHNLPREARQRVTFLDGSLLNNSDLKRCACGNAKIVWIMADTTGSSDPWDEDKENILRALSLSVRYPKTPMMLMLLMPESKSKALSVGIPAQRCFCLDEIKSGLFWQSCRCIGFNTMMSNLMVTTEAEVTDAEVEASPWVEHYVDGMGFEVYGLLAVEEFLGKPLVFLVEEAYRRNRVCILAAQINGVVVLAPLQLQVVTDRTVLFALAQDEMMLHGLGKPGSTWKAVFLENSMREWQRHAMNEDAQELPLGAAVSRLSRGFGPPGDRWSNGAVAPTSRGSSWQPGRYSMTMGSEPSMGAEVSMFAPRAFQSMAQNRNTALYRQQSTVSMHKSLSMTASNSQTDTGLFKGLWNLASKASGSRLTSRSRRTTAGSQPEKPARVSRISRWGSLQSLQEDIPAATLQAPAHWHSRSNSTLEDPAPPSRVDDQFLMELEERTATIQRRAPTQPFILVLEFSGEWGPVVSFVELSRQKHLPFRMPIVVLCPEAPDDELEGQLQLRQDASLSFVWGNPHSVRDLIRAGVNDCSIVVGLGQSVGQANSEMAAMLDSDVVMIYRMLENMSKGKTNMIFQFNRTNSMWLLPIEDSGVGAFDEGAGSGRTMLESAYLDPRFASGRVFAPQALGSLLAHCFHVPGMVEVVECMVQPDDAEADAKLPWQVRVRPEFVGAKYVDLFMDLIQDPVHPVLPVGIYRQFASKAVPGNRGFVWTNPPTDTVLQASDMVYVLGDASFGQLAHSADLMPMGPPGLTNLMAFRPLRMS